jgi:hypothetical protein
MRQESEIEIENRSVAWANPLEMTGVAEQAHDDANTASETLDDEMNRKSGPRSGRDALRPRKPRDYSHLHVDLKHTAIT